MSELEVHLPQQEASGSVISLSVGDVVKAVLVHSEIVNGVFEHLTASKLTYRINLITGCDTSILSSFAVAISKICGLIDCRDSLI